MADESVTGEPPRGGPLFGVFLLSNLTARVLEPTLRPIGITPGEYGLYSLLRLVGPITPSEVASRGGMAATTVSYLVRRLETRGHVVRTTREDDRRSAVLELTAAGHEVHERAHRAVQQLSAEYVAALRRPTAEVRDVLADLEQALRTVLANREAR
jgi:DNA-binding MarR family transcriptional regulator